MGRWFETVRGSDEFRLDQYKYKGLLSLALNDARYLEDPATADRQNMRELEPFIMD